MFDIYFSSTKISSIRYATVSIRFFTFSVSSSYLYFFLNSHPLFRCRCVVEVRLLPDLSVLGHIFRLSRTCQIQLVFRYLPAFLHRLHHRHHRRYRFLPTYCFGRFLVCCSGCPEGFHPIGRTSRPGLVGSVGFWDLFLRLCFGPVLFCAFFRSEIMFPK